MGCYVPSWSIVRMIWGLSRAIQVHCQNDMGSLLCLTTPPPWWYWVFHAMMFFYQNDMGSFLLPTSTLLGWYGLWCKLSKTNRLVSIIQITSLEFVDLGNICCFQFLLERCFCHFKYLSIDAHCFYWIEFRCTILLIQCWLSRCVVLANVLVEMYV